MFQPEKTSAGPALKGATPGLHITERQVRKDPGCQRHMLWGTSLALLDVLAEQKMFLKGLTRTLFGSRWNTFSLEAIRCWLRREFRDGFQNPCCVEVWNSRLETDNKAKV